MTFTFVGGFVAGCLVGIAAGAFVALLGTMK